MNFNLYSPNRDWKFHDMINSPGKGYDSIGQGILFYRPVNKLSKTKSEPWLMIIYDESRQSEKFGVYFNIQECLYDAAGNRMDLAKSVLTYQEFVTFIDPNFLERQRAIEARFEAQADIRSNITRLPTCQTPGSGNNSGPEQAFSQNQIQKLSECFGINPNTLHAKLNILNMTLDQALGVAA